MWFYCGSITVLGFWAALLLVAAGMCFQYARRVAELNRIGNLSVEAIASTGWNMARLNLGDWDAMSSKSYIAFGPNVPRVSRPTTRNLTRSVRAWISKTWRPFASSATSRTLVDAAGLFVGAHNWLILHPRPFPCREKTAKPWTVRALPLGEVQPDWLEGSRHADRLERSLDPSGFLRVSGFS